MMPNGDAIDEAIEDVYNAKYEKEREAIGAIYPSEKDFWHRIKIITTLSGRAPNLQDLYLAYCEWKIWDAMEKNSKIDFDELDPVRFLTSYALSLKGRHADRAVEIARASQINAKPGLLDRLLGRE